MTELVPVDECIWLAEGDTVSFYGFPYPTRMVVVQLPRRQVWVWSPIGLTANLRAEIDALVRDKPGQFKGGMFTPSDGRAEPFKAVPAIARALQRRSGLVRENCAVRTLGKGDCVGELAYISEGEHTATVTAQNNVLAIKLDVPISNWGSIPVQMRFNSAFQKTLARRLATTTRELGKFVKDAARQTA